ncbi:DUF659 domain-containing protein/Dimer_Tnp_hAT domain-containing protein [Senna tora]|uniref:DUF659 domain-containing protein/Dimer_Tnp_hAT domain-containing protein n=1 Tax=Senna tora TaxID=362788 RepID=A0A834W753_9FABA|nr:DUF659 domain-containing protein/Dimer_Tnp_hAT domain-containing protein [Senna tora]
MLLSSSLAETALLVHPLCSSSLLVLFSPLLSASARRLYSSSKASLLCSKASLLCSNLEGFSNSARSFFSSSARTVSRCWCLRLCSNALPLGGELKLVQSISPSKLEELKKLDSEFTLNEESIAPTRFASTIVMLKRFRLIKHGLQEMVISEKWSSYKEDDVGKAELVKEKILNDLWYYSYDWLRKDPRRVPPHQDSEVTVERIKCLKRYFPNSDDRRKVNIEFANFSDGREGFQDINCINDKSVMDAKTWWLIHGVNAPILQKIALKLLGQPSSSSCCERNWSTYSFIHSVRRNKMKPKRAEDLVYVHTNLRLLSRKPPQYKTGESSMWDIAGDEFSPIDDEHGILEVANLSLDEPELERVIFIDESNNMDGGQRGVNS